MRLRGRIMECLLELIFLSLHLPPLPSPSLLRSARSSWMDCDWVQGCCGMPYCLQVFVSQWCWLLRRRMAASLVSLTWHYVFVPSARIKLLGGRCWYYLAGPCSCRQTGEQAKYTHRCC